jgi:hypothetical protein
MNGPSLTWYWGEGEGRCGVGALLLDAAKHTEKAVTISPADFDTLRMNYETVTNI